MNFTVLLPNLFDSDIITSLINKAEAFDLNGLKAAIAENKEQFRQRLSKMRSERLKELYNNQL